MRDPGRRHIGNGQGGVGAIDCESSSCTLKKDEAKFDAKAEVVACAAYRRTRGDKSGVRGGLHKTIEDELLLCDSG